MEDNVVKRIYCPNCGKVLSATKNKDGLFKFICGHCGCCSVAKVVSRRKVILEVTYNPKKVEDLF